VSRLKEEIAAALGGHRAAVLGVGSRLRADDGFGPLVVDLLQGMADCDLLDCGNAPENFAGKIRDMAPGVVLVADAADFGGEAGELRLVEGESSGASGLSTHAAGLNMLFGYLEAECGAKGWLLACQPEGVELGGEMSEAVRGAAGRAAGLLTGVLARRA
jgi:hydrogenase 3 maturation protease